MNKAEYTSNHLYSFLPSNLEGVVHLPLDSES